MNILRVIVAVFVRIRLIASAAVAATATEDGMSEIRDCVLGVLWTTGLAFDGRRRTQCDGIALSHEVGGEGCVVIVKGIGTVLC